MPDSYVCSGAMMRCTMGTSPAQLTVLPVRTVNLSGPPMANISDNKSMVNLAPFGLCRSLAFPPTAAATAAALGTLTPMPCMHNTPSPWIGGKMDYLIKGQPALLKSCKCQCMWGGTISLITDGQVDSGPADMSRVAKTIINEASAKTSCLKSTQEFYNDKKNEKYAESPEIREELALSFYNDVKGFLGIDSEISFAEMPPQLLGGYNPSNNTIELNNNYLDDPDCSDLLNTILHESRHAFQNKAISDPNSVSVDTETINAWKANFDNYVSSDWGYEAYRNQPIESDAFDFADEILEEAMS